MRTPKLSSGPPSWCLPLLVAAFTDPLPADAADGQFGPNDFRITHVGPDGNPNHDAEIATVVWNPVAQEYLVTWNGDHVSSDVENFAQRVAPDGSLIGAPFQVSLMGPPGTAIQYRADNAGVSVNPDANEYLFTWSGDHTVPGDGEEEVFGRRVDAAGNLLGSQFRISTNGPDGDTALDARGGASVYNVTAGEYLVLWLGELVDGVTSGRGQRLDASGNEVGENDFLIDDLGATAWNSVDNEYLMARTGPHLAFDDFEIFVQRFDPLVDPIGPSDIRITNIGTPGDVRGVQAVVHNPVANEYLVAFSASQLGQGLPDQRIQRLDADANEMGPDDHQITNIPATSSGVLAGDAAYIPGANEYLVVSKSDTEIYVQRVDAEGAEVGPDDLLISDGPWGNPSIPQVACRDSTGECLITWIAFVASGEQEVIGQLFGVPVPEPVPQASVLARASLALLLGATGAALLWRRRRFI